MRKRLLCAIAAVLLSIAPSFAQSSETAPQEPSPRVRMPGPGPDTQVRREYRPDFSDQEVRTFTFAHLSAPTEIQDVVNAMRMILEFQRVQPVPYLPGIILRGTPDQISRAAKLIGEMDKPGAGEAADYRLVFTIHQLENGRKVDDHSYAILITRSKSRDQATKYSLRAGSRVPITTESAGGNAVSTSFNYQDVGVNFDCRLWGTDEAMTIQTTVEISSASNAGAASGSRQPVIRQAKVDLVSPISAGKPVTIAAIDEVDAPRHIDIDVTATRVK